jgi:hypothetical protein
MEVALTMARNVKTPERFAVDPEVVSQFGEEFADLFEVSDVMKVEYETVGIPEEIRIIPPDMPKIKFDTKDIPKEIKILGVDIPQNIQIHGPENPIPNSIRFDSSELPEEIPLVYEGKPIPVDITTTVELKTEMEIPKEILIKMPEPIPERIVLEHDLPKSISLEGPESIPISIPEGLTLPLEFPESLPPVEMVYRGAPIELKITMDEILNKEADGRNCVMIIPCPGG